MRIRWAVPAAEDLEGIWSFLQQRNPEFAETTMRRIYLRIQSLRISPYLGKPGSRSGTRELALTPLPYIVVYAVRTDIVEILHIHHGAQDWR